MWNLWGTSIRTQKNNRQPPPLNNQCACQTGIDKSIEHRTGLWRGFIPANGTYWTIKEQYWLSQWRVKFSTPLFASFRRRRRESEREMLLTELLIQRDPPCPLKQNVVSAFQARPVRSFAFLFCHISLSPPNYTQQSSACFPVCVWCSTQEIFQLARRSHFQAVHTVDVL